MNFDSNQIYLCIAVLGFFIGNIFKPIGCFIMSLFKKKEEETKELQEENPLLTQNDLLKFEQKCDDKYVSCSKFDSEFNAVEGKLSALDLKVDTNHNQVMSTLLQMQQQIYNAMMQKGQ